MNLAPTVKELKTVTEAQWNEIAKFAAIGKIKNEIADLLESAPELELDSTIEFIHGLAIRELSKRKI